MTEYPERMPCATPEAQREYQRRWVTQRRADWIAENGPCVDCGGTDALEVDHVDPATKAMEPSAVWSRRREVRERELAKCVVRCERCHLIRTSAQRAATPIPHGTDAGYTKRKCRCGDCREAHRLAKQAWRDQRKTAGLSYT